jgi:hypothetical protein
MESSGVTVRGAAMQGATSAVFDISTVITQVGTVDEARALPKGALIGDIHGGLTFSDPVAYALEKRSCRGWFEMVGPDGSRWTVIRLNR